MQSDRAGQPTCALGSWFLQQRCGRGSELKFLVAPYTGRKVNARITPAPYLHADPALITIQSRNMSNGIQDVSDLQIGLIGMGEASPDAHPIICCSRLI